MMANVVGCSDEATGTTSQLIGEAIQSCKLASLDLSSHEIGGTGKRKLETGAANCSSVQELRHCIDRLTSLKVNLEEQENKRPEDYHQLPSNADGDTISTANREAVLKRIQACLLRMNPYQTGASEDEEKRAEPFPTSLKDELISLVNSLLPADHQLLFAGFLVCPWLSLVAYQSPVSTHHLHIIYRSSNRDFLAYHGDPTYDQRQREVATFVCSPEGNGASVVVMELRGWTSRVAKSQVSAMEVLFLPERCKLVATAEWRAVQERLRTTLEETGLSLGTCLPPDFGRRCRGQAISSIMADRKSSSVGRLVNIATTRPLLSLLTTLCASLRLLGHLECLLTRQELVLDCCEAQLTGLSPQNYSASCLSAVRGLLNADTSTRTRQNWMTLLAPVENALREWDSSLTDREKLSKKEKNVQRNQPLYWLQSWIREVRLAGRSLCDPITSWSPAPESGEYQRLTDILAQIEANCPGTLPPGLTPDRIVMATQAGSRLYNLTNQASDTDWLIIYADTRDMLAGSLEPSIRELYECRGTEYSVEFGAYEARLLADLLNKGSVVHVELVFVDPDRLDWASPVWRELHASMATVGGGGLANEVTVAQCMGLVWNMVETLKKGVSRAKKCPGKLLYQIRHKITTVEALISGRRPSIRIEPGAQHDWIMAAREMTDITVITEKAEQEANAMMRKLTKRKCRLIERCNCHLLNDWLRLVRNWPESPAF